MPNFFRTDVFAPRGTAGRSVSSAVRSALFSGCLGGMLLASGLSEAATAPNVTAFHRPRATVSVGTGLAPMNFSGIGSPSTFGALLSAQFERTRWMMQSVSGPFSRTLLFVPKRAASGPGGGLGAMIGRIGDIRVMLMAGDEAKDDGGK